MPSRKGPSQRDPIVRLGQAVRTVAPPSMGGRVSNAAHVTPGPAAVRAPRKETEAVFSTSATPIPGQHSGPYPVNDSGAVRRFRVSLTTAGTSSTVVKLYLNGTEIASVTIAAGVSSGSAVLSQPFTDGEILSVAASTVGTDVTGMTAVAYLAA